MRRKIISTVSSIIMLLSFVWLQTYTVSATNDTSSALQLQSFQLDEEKSTDENMQIVNENLPSCRHGIICEFDDQTMTLTNAYEGNRVKNMM